MTLAETILSQLPVAVLSLLAGMWIQKRREAKRREIDFFLESYQDMWRLVQNVDGVIQRGRRVNHEEITEPIRQKYSCGDINSFLKNCVKPDDAQLTDLLNKFSENLIAYSSETGRLQFPSMGDGRTDYAGISMHLTEEIRKRIKRYLKG
jgi:hypothetical protein